MAPRDSEDGRRANRTRTARAVELVRRGLRNPRQIPPFVLGALFPNSRWAPNWREADGFITFEDGGFAGGDPSRPELSARIYREVTQMRSLVPDRDYERSLEVGCGYGRLSGWIADHAAEAVAVEPNGDALATARELYPDITFVETTGEDMPFDDGSCDLVVAWAVLQHVPPGAVEAVLDEVTRVLADDGTLLLCERTAGEPGRASWPRSAAEYESLVDGYELAATGDRGTEPTYDYDGRIQSMLFTAEGEPRAAAERPLAGQD